MKQDFERAPTVLVLLNVMTATDWQGSSHTLDTRAKIIGQRTPGGDNEP
jgi:hypothetical protein